MAPDLTREEQIAAFHELWDLRYQILNNNDAKTKRSKVTLTDSLYLDLECCRYDAVLYLVNRMTREYDEEDIMIMRRMNTGAVYYRINSVLSSFEGFMDYAKEHHPEFFEFIVFNVGGGI